MAGSTLECRQSAQEHLKSLENHLGDMISGLGALLQHMEIVDTTYFKMIFKIRAFSVYSHLCIYLSMYLYRYPSIHCISGLTAGDA